MSVRVLLFGATADIAGQREFELKVEDGTTPTRLLAHAIKQYPALASHKLHISLNQQYANGDEIVGDGDELAIFTAVSGG